MIQSSPLIAFIPSRTPLRSMRRSRFLQCLAALSAAGVLPCGALAVPDRRMHLMIPANPGGGWDSTGRALGKALLESGVVRSVAYENRGGAAGAMGLAQFYTAWRGDPGALIVVGAVMLGGIITGKPPVSLSQLTPVARLTNEYNVFVLPANSPFRSMKEVMEQLRQDPVSVRWGGGSRGSTEHIAAAQIALSAGVAASKINYVPFRGGGEAAAAILSGNVTLGGSGYSEFAAHIARGGMKPIAVTSPQRIPGVDAPTLREIGVDLDIGNWRGVFGAAGISAQQREDLTLQVVQATRTPSWTAALKQHGWSPALLTGPAFDAFVERDFAELRRIMERAGMV
jgi:putative tricarboxylic transport membrane protein